MNCWGVGVIIGRGERQVPGMVEAGSRLGRGLTKQKHGRAQGREQWQEDGDGRRLRPEIGGG
jgi:hypothetical protein